MVSSGQILAALIQFLAAPILGRLYTPQEYGTLGAYMAIATVLAAIGNWQLAQGLVVERSVNKAASLFQACKWATLCTSLLACAVAAVLIAWIFATTPTPMAWWYLLLPLSTYVGGSNATLSALANRWGIYRRMAIILLVPVGLSVTISIAMGWWRWGAVGLMCSYLIGQVATLVMYMFMVPRLPMRSATASWTRVRAMMRKYRRFAIYTTPTMFISSFTMNAPIYAMTVMGATAMVGLYSRANQLLSLPVHLIGISVAQVFQRRAAIQYHETGNCWPLFQKTLLTLLAVGVPPILLLAFFAPALFTLFLGPNWTEAGHIARILSPVLLLRVVSSPLSTVFYIVGKQREDFILSLVTSLVTVMLIVTSIAWGSRATSVVIGFVVGQVLMYLAYLIWSARYAIQAKQGLAG